MQKLKSSLPSAVEEDESELSEFSSKKQGAQLLAKFYSPQKRLQEVISVYSCLFLMFIDIFYLLKFFNIGRLLPFIIATFCGILAADLVSGLVHWGADTWGSIDVPLFGKTLIRRFRGHHLDPTSMTRRDWIQTNGDNFLVISPLLIKVAWTMMMNSNVNDSEYFSCAFMLLFSIFVALTNQIHKWSHTQTKLPYLVELLQTYHIILPKKHHRIHHISPHDTYYCITTGWLNWPLEKLNFWSTVEMKIEKFTGCKPREDDMKWANFKQ